MHVTVSCEIIALPFKICTVPTTVSYFPSKLWHVLVIRNIKNIYLFNVYMQQAQTAGRPNSKLQEPIQWLVAVLIVHKLMTYFV
jgi:hypothetical protein